MNPQKLYIPTISLCWTKAYPHGERRRMSLGMSSAGFTSDSVRAKLKDEKANNARLLEENRILLERLQKKDDDSVYSLARTTATVGKY